MKRKLHPKLPGLFLIVLFLSNCTSDSNILPIEKGDHITLIGNNLGSRMLNYGYFETELQLRYPNDSLTIRNMCDGGNTPGFRPHSGRNEPWAFLGADTFQVELATPSGSIGHLETPDEWLTHLKTDVIIAFFGYNESFEGKEGLANYKAELDAFIKHTLTQQYNGTSAPRLALVSPIAFQDLTATHDFPNGKKENASLQLYTAAMKEVAATNQVHFIDAFVPSKKWFSKGKQLTIDGSQLNDEGYQQFSTFLANKTFGKKKAPSEAYRELVQNAVVEKNWFWHKDYKIPNGVHVFGRRYNPFGADNYPTEFIKIREMTAIRDRAIWEALKGRTVDLAAADAKTTSLVPIETNYDAKKNGGTGNPEYLYGKDAKATLKVPEGYKIELFASEKEFKDLANPVQLSFDNKGRLWVATMPTYPHYKPGDAKPNDKILILEDTDGDGKADKQTIFADNLHLPIGFEIAPEGVYISQGTNLELHTDTDGDDKADKKEILLSGFDDHDTHHAISAFCTDPSGAIYMAEGVFLHTNVETSYGTVRGTNGGFYRYNPTRHHLERVAQLPIPNPWGIAFDEWGQNFYAETSGPVVSWMMPGSMKPYYGVSSPKSRNLIEKDHQVRPTSGLEFVSSRHFPDEVQGDLLINNTIGFLGTKQHQFMDQETGYTSKHRQDLIVGSDPNFRPVDMEFAPDGSLYVVDWHNVLIGHMQHNTRDPLRDHVHGRIYRITYPSRPLVTPAKIDDATIPELLDNLKLPEYRTRYRTRRELRGKNSNEVSTALKTWIADLDKENINYEKHLMEALWVSWGMNQVDQDLLKQLLHAENYRVRTAAVRVLRYTGHQVKNQSQLLLEAAKDEHSRVRLEALIAASWLSPEAGNPVMEEAAKHPMNDWMEKAYKTAKAHLNGQKVEKEKKKKDPGMPQDAAASFDKGRSIYNRDGYCATCHQEDGKGLTASGFPPLVNSKWVNNEERLIKLTLKGLLGPIEVNGKKYPGQVPMTPYGGLLNDEEIAEVLSYVRYTFGNRASPITPEKVKSVRASIKDKQGYYSPAELLQEHPLK